MAGDFLIADDIASPRRLGRVCRYLARVAVPIEYSVFFAGGKMDQVAAILKEVAGPIDKNADNLRCYPLPQLGLKIRFGRATLPQGVYHSDLPAAWMG